MANALVRSRLETLWVKFNGDLDDATRRARRKKKLARKSKRLATSMKAIKRIKGDRAKAKDLLRLLEEVDELQTEIGRLKNPIGNAIVVSVKYPRSGHSSIEAIRPVDLPNGKAANGSPPVDLTGKAFLASGVFKEEIQGEAILEVAVTDTDPKSPIVAFLGRVASTIFGTLTAGVIKDISQVAVSSAASQVSSELKTALAGTSNAKVQVIAKSKKVQLVVLADGRLSIPKAEGVNYANGSLKLTLYVPKLVKIGEEGTASTYLQRGDENGEVQLSLDSELI